MSVIPGFEYDAPLLACIKCGEDKPIEDFSQMNYASGNRTAEIKRTCKSCRTHAKKVLDKLRKENPMPSREVPCPSCGYSLVELDKFDQTVFKSWRLHHDHITEKFLGYVCHICNTGMGNFKDDPQRMRKTADWLESVLK